MTIKGVWDKNVEKRLGEAMEIPKPTPAECLEEVAKLKRVKGAGDDTLSIKTYIQSYEAMQFIVSGNSSTSMNNGYFASKPLSSGRFSSPAKATT